MLREIGAAPDVFVCRDEVERQRLHRELRSGLAAGSAPLVAGWREEPPDVQRALLWLVTVLPEVRAEHPALVDELLPAPHRRGWDLLLADAVDSQEEADAVFALEDWVHGEDER